MATADIVTGGFLGPLLVTGGYGAFANGGIMEKTVANYDPNPLDNTEPGRRVFPIVLDTNLGNIARAFYVGVNGDISLVSAEGDSVILKNAQAGSVIPIAILRINDAGSAGTVTGDYVAIW